MNKQKLGKAELLKRLAVINEPRKHGLTQAKLDEALIEFWAGCPDPVRAHWLMAECLDPMTDEELVDIALAMPARPMTDVPKSIIPAHHPARVSLD